MKPSKAQPPSTQHVIQGVLVNIEDNRAVVCATADRKAKLTSQVANILSDGCLTPQVAGALAGKFGFVASSSYGQVARPVLHAIYMRQKAAGMRRDLQALTPAMRASLTFLVDVLTWAPPRQLDFATARSIGIAYADAFFEMDGVQRRPADSPMSTRTPQSAVSFPNGWGVVVGCPIPQPLLGMRAGSSLSASWKGSPCAGNTSSCWKRWPNAWPRGSSIPRVGSMVLVLCGQHSQPMGAD